MQRIANRSYVVAKTVLDSSPTTLAPGETGRDALIIQNDLGVLYVKLGLEASTTNFTYRLSSRCVLDVDPSWTGPVSAIKGIGTGTVLVTQTV